MSVRLIIASLLFVNLVSSERTILPFVWIRNQVLVPSLINQLIYKSLIKYGFIPRRVDLHEWWWYHLLFLLKLRIIYGIASVHSWSARILN